MMRSRSRPGYIFLMTVLFIGVIGLGAVSSLMLLSWASEQSGMGYAQTTQAIHLANSCAEYALQALKNDPYYGGNDTLIVDQRGSCSILAIARSKNTLIICTEGISGAATRRMQVRVRTLFPTPIIESYKETKDSGACTN